MCTAEEAKLEREVEYCQGTGKELFYFKESISIFGAGDMKMRKSAKQRGNKGWHPVLDNKLIIPLSQGFQNTLQASVSDFVVQSWYFSSSVCH